MKRMMLAAGLLATAGWLGLAQVATAQQPPRPNAPPPPPPGAAQPPGPGAQPGQHQGAAVPMNPKNDQQFIAWAATRNAMELEMGSMAARKAPSQQIRQFGQMLATDHGRSNAKAVALARQMNVRLPENMAPQDRRTIQQFMRLQGPQFDQQFVQHELKDHQHTLSVFEKWAKNAKDPELRKYAEQTVPVLKKHLAAAKKLAGQVGGQTSGAEEQENHQAPPAPANHTNTEQNKSNSGHNSAEQNLSNTGHNKTSAEQNKSNSSNKSDNEKNKTSNDKSGK